MSEALSCEGDGLAREPSDDDIDRLGVCGWPGADVVVPSDVGPVTLEDCAGEGVKLDLPAALEASELAAEVKSADAGEEAAECGR